MTSLFLCVSRCGTTVNDLFILHILQGSLCWKRCNVNGLWCVQSPGGNGIDGATTRRTWHIVAHQDLIHDCYSNNYSWLDINVYLGGDSMIRCSNLSPSFPGMDRLDSGLRLKKTHGLQETFFTSDVPAGDLSSQIWPKKTMGTSCCVHNGPTDVFFQIQDSGNHINHYVCLINADFNMILLSCPTAWSSHGLLNEHPLMNSTTKLTAQNPSCSKVMAYLFICGVQSASRLLFIIWNFNEDIQGREMLNMVIWPIPSSH